MKKMMSVSSLQGRQYVWLMALLLVIVIGVPVSSFGIPSNRVISRTFRQHSNAHRFMSVSDAADEAEERILARIRKRGRRDRFEDDDKDKYYEREDDRDAYYQDVDDDWEDSDDEVVDKDDLYDDEYGIDWEDQEEKEYDLLENVVIPNPLLDSIDPDGAADRFPELASDPRFWIDMALFIAFLNFLSTAGPRDPFPDLPWY